MSRQINNLHPTTDYVRKAYSNAENVAFSINADMNCSTFHGLGGCDTDPMVKQDLIFLIGIGMDLYEAQFINCRVTQRIR